MSVSFRRSTLARLYTLLLATLFALSGVEAAENARRIFDLPADAAEKAIRRFSEQAGLEVFYPSSATRGLRSQPVKGEMTAQAALDAMLAGTGLVVIRDDRSGAFSLKRADDPNAQRAALTASDRPANKALRRAPLSQRAPDGDGVERESETVQLSPFEVRTDQDVGYAAANTLAGGRVNTELKDTPAAISVITRQFMDDVGALGLRELSEWSLNTIPDYSAAQNQDWVVNIRGLGSSYPSRNYFLWYADSDSYATERYEYARGPNGVLFGDGNVGGIMTTTTKRPRFGRASYSLSARADSYGGYRATLDVNRPAGERLAIRFNALVDRSESWQDGNTDSDRTATHLAATLRLAPRTHLRVEGEGSYRRRDIYPYVYSDQASFWDRTTTFDGITPPITAGAGITRMATTPYFVYIPAVPQAGFSNWTTFYRSTGYGIIMRPEARTDLLNVTRLPSRGLNMGVPDAINVAKYYTFSASVDHQFSDNLYVEVGFNRLLTDYHGLQSDLLVSVHNIDVNRVLPTGAPNPKFGVPYTDTQRLTNERRNNVGELRALAGWRFERNWLKQNVNLIAGTRKDVFDFISLRLRRINGANPIATSPDNAFFQRFYWDQPGQVAFGNPVVPGIDFGYQPERIVHERKSIDYAQVAATSRLFRDRLTIFLGARGDQVFRFQRSTDGVPLDPATGLPQLGAVVAQPGPRVPIGVVGAKAITNVKPFNRNAGVVYYVLPWFGLYANHSQTFAPPGGGNNLIDGRPPGIARSQGYDLGFKFNLGGKLLATFNYYDSAQTDRLDFANTRATEINRIWTNLGRLDRANLAYRDTQTFVGSGYEFEITANPSPALRLTANLALPTTEAKDLYPGLRGYVAQYLPEWEAGAADPENSQRTQIQADINSVRTLLDTSVPGVVLNNTYKYTGNLYATYSLREGALKGVAFGLGGNFRGRTKVSSLAANPFSYLYADAYTVLSGHVNYRRRLGKVMATFQLNAYNLLDNDKQITTNYGDYRQNNSGANPLMRIPNSFRYLDPRKIAFTTTLGF